jgi:SAM-dependent methyltransferase
MMGRFVNWVRRKQFAWSQASEARFDHRHGVDTSGLMLRPRFVNAQTESDECAVGYYGTIRPHFDRIVRLSGVQPSDYTFVDLGCGKGRTLLLASRFGFKRVVGVELDPAFADQARRNADVWVSSHGGPHIEVIEEDAARYELPAGNLFVYMYNPFRGSVFQSVADRLGTAAGQRGQKIVIAYNVDLHADMLERTGAFIRRRLRPRRFWARPTVSYFYSFR